MSHHGKHGYTKTKQIRLERHERALAVQKESGYATLSTQAKLDRVLSFIAVPGNGSASKEIAKLEATLKKELEKKAVETTEPTDTGDSPKKGKKFRK